MTTSAPEQPNLDVDEGLRHLPPYSRSLLKVRIPVIVTLAATKEKVSRILSLGPGSIIQFRKNCEEPLTLEAGGRDIAAGEAVKVGDKFGLWITSVLLPEERFVSAHESGRAPQK